MRLVLPGGVGEGGTLSLPSQENMSRDLSNLSECLHINVFLGKTGVIPYVCHKK